MKQFDYLTKLNIGYIVDTYEYDAWGNITYQEGAIADINPFRYRGYYYDNETGFYYLQTRYYDPTTMRFINADNYELIAQLSTVPGQLNMYAYCGNNPIKYIDPSGEFIGFWTMFIGALLGAVVSASIEVANQVNENGWDSINIARIGLSFLGGALGGAAAATSLGIGWQIAINVSVFILQDVAIQTSSNNGFDVINMLKEGGKGFIAGCFGGAGLRYVKDTFEMQIKNYLINESFREMILPLSYSILRSSLINIIR
ncbi:MAG: RHS repeat-associated core domain-containing protein [Clostridia bacterium]|nr:RHS repeat-associated core domain-containing protein [Clostridia bacterium]